MSAADLDDVFAAAEQGESAGDLSALIVAEMGKTRGEADGEAGKAAEFFEYYGGLARLPFGELIPDGRPGTFSTQTREPLGVVLLITPWNDPLLTQARKLAPALLAGNAMVLKPATETPLIALKLAEILNHAGIPAGVLGTVTGRGSEIGDLLSSDHRVHAVSFTGSTSVGLDLQRKLAGTGIRVQTERGGKNAAVVLDDADLDLAASVVMAGAFGQASQRCTATSRLIIQRGIAEELKHRVSVAVTELRVGPGDTDGVNLGPVVSKRAQADIRSRVVAAISEGATVIAKAYGLSSAIFTRNLEAAYRFIEHVDTGQVPVNQPTSGWDVHQPFGGFKESGSPFKEQGLEALRLYTRVKTAAIRTQRE